jgi:hypothetical protein
VQIGLIVRLQFHPWLSPWQTGFMRRGCGHRWDPSINPLSINDLSQNSEFNQFFWRYPVNHFGDCLLRSPNRRGNIRALGWCDIVNHSTFSMNRVFAEFIIRFRMVETVPSSMPMISSGMLLWKWAVYVSERK